jgi:protein TonB
MNEQNLLEFVEGYVDQKANNRRGFKVATSFVIHVFVVGALVVAPLVFLSNDMPEVQAVTTFLAIGNLAPPPPPPAPPPAAQRSKPLVERPSIVPTTDLKFKAPVEVPDQIIPEDDFGFGDVDFGVPGGVEGGIPGGVLEGVVGGLPAAPPAPEPSQPIRLDFRSEEAIPIRRVNPDYPDLAKRARAQGVVILEVLVSQNGMPQTWNVLRSLPLLESAAIDAVKQWRWKPFTVNGEGVPFWVTVTVTFKLTDVAE